MASEPLEHAQPLTKRPLRYLRRNARRAAEYNFFLAQICGHLKTRQLTESDSILNTHGPADRHDFPAQKPVTKREGDDKANHRPLECPPNRFTPHELLSPLSPPRAPHRRSMTSTTATSK